MCSPVPVTSPGSKCTREWHRWSRWGVGWKVGMSLVTFIEYYIYILPPKQTWSQGPWKRVYSIVLGVFGLCSTLHGFWWKKWYGHLAAKGFFFFSIWHLANGDWRIACCGSQTKARLLFDQGVELAFKKMLVRRFFAANNHVDQLFLKVG